MEITNRPPDRLFRYRSASTSFLFPELEKVLARKVYFSAYESMNDPFEARPRKIKSSLRELVELTKVARRKAGIHALVSGSRIDVSGSRNRPIKSAFNRNLRQPVKMAHTLRKTAERTLGEVSEKHSLICLSEVPNSLLMWAHYANGHNGVVIGYEFDESAILKGDTKNPVRVRYSDQRPSVSDSDILKFGSKLDGIRDEAVIDRVFESIWLTKSNEWAYEKEWRVISPGSVGYVQVNSLKPVEIIIGAAVDPRVQAQIIDLMSGKISIRKATLNAECFYLDFIEIPR